MYACITMITFKNRIMKKITTKVLWIIASLVTTSLSFIGCSDDDIELPPVEASFTVNINQENRAAAFTNTSENATNFVWDFGDGNTSTQRNPTNIYAAGGQFIVELTASNSAGASDTATETITINNTGNPIDNGEDFDSGLLANGDFEGDTSPWIGGGLNIQTEGGNSFQRVNVEVAGNLFDVNISQLVDLVEGTNYTLSFDASSTTEQIILAGIGLNEEPFTNNSQEVALTSQLTRYSLNLTANGFGGSGNRVLFDMGGAVGIVTIDNVSLVITEVEEQEPSDFDSGLLINGDFENGVSPWIIGVDDNSPAPVATEAGNTFYSVNVEAVGNPFDVNVSQKLEIVDGSTYTITFDAWSDRERAILAGIGLSGGSFAANSESVAINMTRNTYSVTLTANGFGAPDARVLFDSGAELGIVNIDNVSLIISEPVIVDMPSDFDSGLLINGDFENGVSPWIIGVDDNSPAPVATEAGNTFYSVNVEAVGNPFDVNVSQKLEIVDGSTYTITFDAWSDRERTILAGIGLSGGSFAANSESVAINMTRNTYSVTLTANGFGAPDARVLFDSGAELGIVNIDNVSLVLESSGMGGMETGGGDMASTGGCDGELVAATSLPLDFEGCETFPSDINFGNGLTSALVDVTTIPNVTSIAANPAGFALQINKPTGSDFFAGVQNIFANNFDLTTTNTFRANVLSTKANVVFRVELLVSPNDGSIGNPAPVFVTIPTANTWTEIEFTFENLPASPTTYNQLVIKPDNDMADSGITNGGTYYIDDLRLE